MLDIKFTFMIKIKYCETSINVNSHNGKVEGLSYRYLISKMYKCSLGNLKLQSNVLYVLSINDLTKLSSNNYYNRNQSM